MAAIFRFYVARVIFLKGGPYRVFVSNLVLVSYLKDSPVAIIRSSSGPNQTLQAGKPTPWASFQIRKIAGCACAGNVFPATDFKGNR